MVQGSAIHRDGRTTRSSCLTSRRLIEVVGNGRRCVRSAKAAKLWPKQRKSVALRTLIEHSDAFHLALHAGEVHERWTPYSFVTVRILAIEHLHCHPAL